MREKGREVQVERLLDVPGCRRARRGVNLEVCGAGREGGEGRTRVDADAEHEDGRKALAPLGERVDVLAVLAEEERRRRVGLLAEAPAARAISRVSLPCSSPSSTGSTTTHNWS